MTECQKCSRKAQLFLCPICIRELRDMLTALAGVTLAYGERAAGWLEHLYEAATGQAKFGQMLRYARTDESPLKFNEKASDLLAYAESVLTEWVRDLCEQRGITWAPVRSVELAFIGPLLPEWRRLPADYRATPVDAAEWLSAHVSAIASDEGAGVAYREIKELVDDIEHLIDRPRPRRFCGPCPAQLDQEHRKDCGKAHPHACGVALMADREATEVKCPACKTTHDVHEVTAQALTDIGDWSFTQHELLHVVLPAFSQPVPARTFRSWCHGRKLIPVKYRRPDGTDSLTWTGPADKPMYQLSDVRQLRDEKPQSAPTGAAASRRKSPKTCHAN